MAVAASRACAADYRVAVIAALERYLGKCRHCRTCTSLNRSAARVVRVVTTTGTCIGVIALDADRVRVASC